MNKTELEASWLITRGHLAAARTMLPSPPKENPEESGRIEDYEEWMANNELELALDALDTIGAANDCPAAFWQALAAAAANMGLVRHYPSRADNRSGE